MEINCITDELCKKFAVGFENTRKMPPLGRDIPANKKHPFINKLRKYYLYLQSNFKFTE
jgi:hypothetical protein